MILDGLLLFTGTSNGSTRTSSAAYADLPVGTTGTTYSANVLDLGLVGIPALSGSSGTGAGGGARDLGVGDDPALKVLVDVTVAFDNITSLQIIVQGTHDDGTGIPYATDWTTMASGPVVALAQLTAGARICDIDLPRPAPGQAMPRYLRLGYVQVASSPNDSGLLVGTLVLDRFDQPVGSTNALSGYPAGIVVAN
jgi:hypothetical protein